MKKTFLLSAMIISFASTVNAADAPEPIAGDVSSADIQWSGHAKILPGNDIIITGKDSASTPNTGELTVNADGTFTTKVAVDLESRLYYDKDGDDVKEAGELFATSWSLDTTKPMTVTWGTNVTAGIAPTVKDSISGSALTDVAGPNSASQISLLVSNETPASTTPTDPRADLSVQATIIATTIPSN